MDLGKFSILFKLAVVMSTVASAQSRYNVSSIIKNCTMYTEQEGLESEIDGAVSGKHLIKFVLNFKDSENVYKGDKTSAMYNVSHWMLSPGRAGDGILSLRPMYDMLSLYTLELHVVTMTINAKVQPQGCLKQLEDRHVEKIIRAFVMNKFKNSSLSGVENKHKTCNLHIRDDDGFAVFQYYCCQTTYDHSDEITCAYHETGTWLHILFVVMTIVKILVILFCPIWVPDSLYRLRYQAKYYKHKVAEKSISFITMVTHRDGNVLIAQRSQRFDIGQFAKMTTFFSSLQQMVHDVPYRLTVKEITLHVTEERVLGSDSAPVGVFKTFYEAIFKCQIRDREAFRDCCYANMLMKTPLKERGIPFYNFCERFMTIIILLLLCVPWLIRVVLYYEYEDAEYEARKEAADQRKLDFTFPGTFALYLTPIHVLFIIIYIILSIEMCAYGVIGSLGTEIGERLKFVTRKCFRDMREMDIMGVMGWVVNLMLSPCTSWGVIGLLLGIILFPFLLPIVLIICAFYIFPTVNITFRFLSHLIGYIFPCIKLPRYFQTATTFLKLQKLHSPEGSSEDSQEQEKNLLRSVISRIQQIFIIICCLISLYSVIFLFVELVSFVIEIIVYTMMGLILNAGTVLKIVSLVLILFLYGQDCFGHITKTFSTFNQKINGILLGMAMEKIEGVVFDEEKVPDNYAFIVKSDHCKAVDKPLQVTTSFDGKPEWGMNRLVVFFDKELQPYIPTKLYYKACNMNYFAAPGDILSRYLKAALEFGTILLFLLFVFIVVMAFGNRFALSATNELLVTVMGGLVPLLLRKVVFKSYAIPDIDQTSIHFQVALTDLLEPYEEAWPAIDLIVEVEQLEQGYDDKIDVLIEASADADSPRSNLELNEILVVNKQD